MTTAKRAAHAARREVAGASATRRVAAWLGLLAMLAIHAGPGGGAVRAAAPGADAVVRGALFGAAVVSETVYVVVGDGGRIFRTEDRGRHFEAIASGTALALTAIRSVDVAHAWVVGQAGTILRTTDGGQHWQTQLSPSGSDLLGVDFVDPRHGIAVGADATVLATHDGGEHWIRVGAATAAAIDADTSLFAATMLDEARAVIAGDRGRILVTADGGASWEAVSSFLRDEALDDGRPLYALARGGAAELLVAGLAAALGRSVDGGATWSRCGAPSTDAGLFAVKLAGADGLTVGAGGTVLRTSDGGATWVNVDVPEWVERAALVDVDLARDTSGRLHGLVVGQDGTIAIVKGAQLEWSGRAAARSE